MTKSLIHSPVLIKNGLSNQHKNLKMGYQINIKNKKRNCLIWKWFSFKLDCHILVRPNQKMTKQLTHYRVLIGNRLSNQHKKTKQERN